MKLPHGPSSLRTSDIATSRGSDCVMPSARRIAVRSAGLGRSPNTTRRITVEGQVLHPRMGAQRHARLPARDLVARERGDRLPPARERVAVERRQQQPALAQVLGAGEHEDRARAGERLQHRRARAALEHVRARR